MLEVRCTERTFLHIMTQLIAMLTVNKMAGLGLTAPISEAELLRIPLPGGEGYCLTVNGSTQVDTMLSEYFPGGIQIFNIHPVPLDQIKLTISGIIQSVNFSEFHLEEDLKKMIQPPTTVEEDASIPEA